VMFVVVMCSHESGLTRRQEMGRQYFRPCLRLQNILWSVFSDETGEYVVSLLFKSGTSKRH